MLNFLANMAREVDRQPIIVLNVSEVIAEAGNSVFNMIVWKRDEMSYILFNNNTPDSQKDTYL